MTYSPDVSVSKPFRIRFKAARKTSSWRARTFCNSEVQIRGVTPGNDSNFQTAEQRLLSRRGALTLPHVCALLSLHQWLGAPSCQRGSYAFYKSVSSRAQPDGPVQVWKLGEFYFIRCGPQDPVCIAEVRSPRCD